MRRCVILLALSAVLPLLGCAQLMPQDTAAQARSQFAKCGAENRITTEGRMIAGRLWMGDATDTAAKLLDSYPLTPPERAALVKVHDRAAQCRQIVIAQAAQSAPWQSPYLQEYAQRSDEIYYRLASGELPVGLANKLSIESDRKLKADLDAGRAENAGGIEGVRTDQARREQATDALLEESQQIAATLPPSKTPAPNCTWLGNTLNCVALR